MARGPLVLAVLAVAVAACSKASDGPRADDTPMPANARIAYLHHSTGGVVWGGGVPAFVASWNAAHGRSYQITELTTPDTGGGYPWENYPYDDWNLWVNHTGASRDHGELNLDDLVAAYDVIVFKHCFPVSNVEPDGGAPSVSSSVRSAENYRAQYLALRARMRQFPSKRFLVWTGAALVEASTDAAEAGRARDFFAWVKASWDEPGDNVYVWDFRALETGGGLYLLPANAASPGDSHPSDAFAAFAAPLVGRRIVDVVEGRGDTGSLTGQ